MYLLDTNTCMRILNGTSLRLVSRLRAENPATIKVSSITRAELLFGARNSERVAANLRLLAQFFAPFESRRREFSRVVGLRIEDWEQAWNQPGSSSAS